MGFWGLFCYENFSYKKKKSVAKAKDEEAWDTVVKWFLNEN